MPASGIFFIIIPSSTELRSLHLIARVIHVLGKLPIVGQSTFLWGNTVWPVVEYAKQAVPFVT